MCFLVTDYLYMMGIHTTLNDITVGGILQAGERCCKQHMNMPLQEEFYRLESRLQTAYIMLLTAMGVQDHVRRYTTKAE
jgi:hypothetical protein